MTDSIQNIVRKLASDLENLHSRMIVSECDWGCDYRRAIQMGDAAAVERLNRELADQLRNIVARKG